MHNNPIPRECQPIHVTRLAAADERGIQTRSGGRIEGKEKFRNNPPLRQTHLWLHYTTSKRAVAWAVGRGLLVHRTFQEKRMAS